MDNVGTGNIGKNTLSYNHERTLTCYHEAGHTISGLLNFIMISSVGVPNRKNKKNVDIGYTYYDLPAVLSDVNDAVLKNALVVGAIHLHFGGIAAEKIFYKEMCGSSTIPKELKYGSHIDRDAATDLIVKNHLAPPGKRRYLYKKSLLDQTIRGLELYWEDVKLISHALYSRKKLLFKDLKEILTKESSNKSFWKSRFKNINLLFSSKFGDQDFLNKIVFE